MVCHVISTICTACSLLSSEVEDIEKELRSLCENPETQQANHGQDREIVLRLLEGLQEVILRYQVCP